MNGDDKETRERLLESARAEFSEKGYMKASLRKICAGAGVTTGALYFFFQDKEDLFRAIVGPPFLELKQLLYGHFALENQQDFATYLHSEGDHDEFSAALIGHLYAHRDEFLMLLTKAQGTRFENAADEMVEMIEKRYFNAAEKMKEAMPGKRVNGPMLHWLSYLLVDAFIQLLKQEDSAEKAIPVMNRFLDFLISGWLKLVLEDKMEN